MKEKYLSNCSKCNKKTIHIIWWRSRSTGIRLQCLECNTKNKRYTKRLNDLEVVEDE